MHGLYLDPDSNKQAKFQHTHTILKIITNVTTGVIFNDI